MQFKSQMELQIEDFLHYLVIEKGLAQNTVESYKRDISNYLKFLYDHDNASWQDISRADVANFLAYLKENKKSPSTISRCISSVRSFHKFLQREKIITHNATELVETPKKAKSLPKFIRFEVVEQLLNNFPDANRFDRRDLAIFETLYGTGIRVSELINLYVDSFSEKLAYVRCIGKGNKERIIPIGKKAVLALNKYLQTSRPRLYNPEKPSNHLFLNHRGQALTRQGLWQIIKQRGHAFGITDALYPHLLRHSCATHMIVNGADVRSVQEMLGHKDVATTQIYTYISNKHLNEVHEKFHPRHTLKSAEEKNEI